MSSSLVILFGVVKQFVDSESGQKQSVKLLQNMVYSTIQPPPPPPETHCLYILYIKFGKEGGGPREDRGTKVHKYSSFVNGANSSQAGSKIPPMSECISSI
jgi:hypothetical protein